MGFRALVSRRPAIQATGLLTLTPRGLTPLERICLLWSHDGMKRLTLAQGGGEREQTLTRALQHARPGDMFLVSGVSKARYPGSTADSKARYPGPTAARRRTPPLPEPLAVSLG